MYSFNLTEDAVDLGLVHMLFDDRTHMSAVAVYRTFPELHVAPLTLGQL